MPERMRRDTQVVGPCNKCGRRQKIGDTGVCAKCRKKYLSVPVDHCPDCGLLMERNPFLEVMCYDCGVRIEPGGIVTRTNGPIGDLWENRGDE